MTTNIQKSNGDVQEPHEVVVASSTALSLEAINELNEHKDNTGLQKLGGVSSVAAKLNSSLESGLSDNDVERNAATYGLNKYKEVPPKSFFRCMWDNLQDPILWLLMFAATVSTVLGAAIEDQRAHHAWSEGVAIWCAVLVVNLVGAANDYQKDQQFRSMSAEKDIFDVKVIRNGKQVLVTNTNLVVGDIIKLDTGDKVTADCILIETFGLVIDEASLTGESDPIHKHPTKDPWVRSGTQVNEGSGKLMVVAVGVNSEWGRTLAVVAESGDDQTPLQEKLAYMAGAIGKVGGFVGAACFVVLLIKWCVRNEGFPLDKINENGPIQFFMYAITIVVVSIPEGLPLAVTIALAYSMKKMMKDNNFVRVLAACETMGGATAICSDKTGTLTENRMTVVEGWFYGKKMATVPELSEVPADIVEDLTKNMALNAKAFIIDKGEGKSLEFVGNRTECALLLVLRGWGLDYEEMRKKHHNEIVKMYEFSSERKMASVLLQQDEKTLRLYNKGAAEWVLLKCSHYQEGTSVVPLTDSKRKELGDVVTEMASRGLRCIAMTKGELPAHDASRPADFLDTPPENNLVLQAVVGIKDPVRKEVPAAVAKCVHAGIMVRMVTGDNIHTAKHIARECGILHGDGVALEGPVFRAMPEEEIKALLPRVQVLARASPKDKHTLVGYLKSLGEVVAVTGDGTNDAPALKESDVGLAMGIAGTEVAKEAADIVILDDNFSSIVKSVLWGRSVFSNIRKFLQFQLTINFVALVVAFIGAIAGGHEPLTVMQLLWVNLIMDSMAALALATEPPTESLLDKKPAGRTEPLINKRIATHILVQGCYQIMWMLIFLYAFPSLINRYKLTSKCEYFSKHCVEDAKDKYKSFSTTYATDICSNFLPPKAPTCKPDISKFSVCGGAKDCQLLKDIKNVDKHVQKEWNKRQEKDMRKALSVLFNAFIICQIANEINVRRIEDEYNIFQGFFQNRTFVAVIIITCGAQAIIMNFLGDFFKVTPINGMEWLICFAIGLGSWPLSTLTRFINRNTWLPVDHGVEEEEKPAAEKVASKE